jgi:hypothetical protein
LSLDRIAKLFDDGRETFSPFLLRLRIVGWHALSA